MNNLATHIKGTRVAVADILQWLSSGMSNEEILRDSPLCKKFISVQLCVSRQTELASSAAT